MSHSFKDDLKLPPEQQAIRDKCFHPTGRFVEFPKEDVETSITARFEKIVGRYPDRPAVKMNNRTLTYQELNHAANRLAHAILAQRGEMPEPVALLMEPDSPLIIVAIVGVLKAGKICVVLDPSFPKARSAFLLEDSQAGFLITDSKNLSLGRELAHDRCRFLNIDELDSGSSIDNPGLAISPDHFAFLVYTSGSTGQPKGVIQNHRNLLHDGLLYCNGLHICPDDRVTLLYSCSTSQGLKITFATLLSGAALYPFYVQQKGVANLALWLNQEEITIYFSIPIIFRQFIGTIAGQAQLPRLRIIQLGSDLVTHRELEDYQKHFSADTILIIRFGTTETGTLRRMFFNVEPRFEEITVPVGYATEDSHISLLDKEGKEVKCGATGEIVVESRYLSPGYWQRPDLTRETFFTTDGGDKRIYHTGDLGRLRSDGLLYHLGRKDFQLSIRGYRVEAGEIEAVLLAQGNVKEALVATGKASPGSDYDRLIAYIVPFETPLPSTSLLRSAAREKLPAYMIPSDFVFLESLPLTPNGKIDRRALPAPDSARPELEMAYVAPQSDIEKQLAQIWAEVLSIKQVGIHDNFFDLGGHSLSATRLVSQVIERFQLEIPLEVLFQSPAVAEMAAVITEHLGRELSDKDGGVAATAPFSLRPIPGDRNLSLSFAQQRLWFLNQLEPDSPVYNQFKALKLRGRLNREALQKALDTIVERHKVLRTTFLTVDDKPAQVIHEPGTVELTAIDLTGIAIEQREEALQRFMSDFTHRPFDLQKDWPLRAALIRLTGTEHILLVVMHHIASDGWSNNILFRELSALYEAFCQGKSSPLEDLPIQYADYAVLQKEWLQGEVLQQQLSYWEKQLKDLSPLELPTDHPRPALLGHLGRTKTFQFPGALAQDLKNLSLQEGVTLFMTLLAAFQTLLHRYTGQDDIVVGSPIAGRTRVEIEGLIGFFVNTLVLRNDLSGNPTFRELLARVRKNALDAYTYQEVPFEKLVEELQPERDLSRNPFFQVMFQLRNYPAQSVSLGDVNIEEYEFGSDIAKFDLSVGLRADVTGLTGSLEYRTDLFDQTTIDRMIGHFQTLLEGIAVKPEQCISELPLLTNLERDKLLVEWNDTETDYPKDKCIHELFEAQVERTPDAIAVVFEDQRLTYRELNNRANQLAHYLRKRCVGPNVLVGICMERTMEMIVALLGILKAGGAYVPLDPSYPESRREFILNDSQVSVLLTNSSFGEESGSRDGDSPSVDPDPRIKSVHLDRDRPALDQESRKNLTAHVQPSDIAYVIYTSGSTGTPKGVAVEHRNAGAFLSWVQSAFTRDELSGVLASTSICFDLSVFEIFAPLTSGGTVIVAENALALATLPKQSTVTLLNTVPSAMSELLNLVAIPESVCVINLAGEPLRTDLVRRIHESSAVAKVHDLYGPSECTTYSTWTGRTPDGPQTIGRPIANTQMYILDSGLNPLPIGVVGEIYIGGDGVARGYLNRPELTAEKFIADPFSEEPGARLYKTGDLARYLSDGNIEFLGRIDDQVKIRGYRIELGEIETVLAQHAAIEQAVVLAREDSPGVKRLVAYVVAAPGRAPSVNELRSFLQQKLPEYMVPAVFMFLDSLPLTPNGKLDRKALPAPDQTRPELEETYSAPRTPVEELLAQIWSDVLKLDQVGVHDNFFHLGGHSLLATQVVSRIRDTFKLDLPVRSLFEAPTIDGLAQRVQELGEKAVRAGTKITRVAREQYRVQ